MDPISHVLGENAYWRALPGEYDGFIRATAAMRTVASIAVADIVIRYFVLPSGVVGGVAQW